MAQIEIRRVQGDELAEQWLPLVKYAFNQSPPLETEEFRTKYQDRYKNRYVVVLFDNGVPVATANLHYMTQSVRGKVLQMGGVAGVATQPQARRKGYARQVVQHLLEQMQEQAIPVSTLYPFRESFYGRLGYVGFVKERIVSVTPATLSTAMNMSVEGRVEYMHIQDAREHLQQLFEKLHLQWHGLGRFSTETEALHLQDTEQWVALAWQGQTLVGAMHYRMQGFAQEMHVPNFMYSSAAGKFLLLNWLARHVDQVSRVWLRLRPDEYIETWTTDSDAALYSAYFNAPHPFDGPTAMGRVSHVEHLGGLKVGEGSVVIAVQDEQCDWNNGTFRFQNQDDTLHVERTAATPDCTLTIQALSALIYGVIDPADFAYRGWGAPSNQVQDKLRRLFPRLLPWLSAQF